MSPSLMETRLEIRISEPDRYITDNLRVFKCLRRGIWRRDLIENSLEIGTTWLSLTGTDAWCGRPFWYGYAGFSS